MLHTNKNSLIQEKPKYFLQLGIVGSVMILLYYLPVFFLGDNAVFAILDALEVDIPYFKLNSKYLFQPHKLYIPELFNGTFRGSIQTSSFLTVILFKIFPSVTAYTVSAAGISAFAFWGLFLLLEKCFISKYHWINFMTALAFSLLPFYPNQGLSAMGLPFLMWATWNINETKRNIFYLPIITYGLSSSLVYSGYVVALFLLLAIGIKSKEGLCKCRGYIKTGAVLLICYFFTHFYSLLSLLYTSHRREMCAEANILPTLSSIVEMIQNGEYHFTSLNHFFCLPVFFVCIIFSITYRRGRKCNSEQYCILHWLETALELIVLIAVFYGIYHAEFFAGIKDSLKILNVISLDRLYVLFPALWYFALAAASQLLISTTINKRFINLVVSKILFLFLMSIIFLIIYGSPFYMANLRKICGREISHCSWKEYFDEQLYEKVKNHIGRPQADYRIVSIGLNPGIALFNGFYCLDGYSVNYPLEYKHEFRKIIAQELDKDPECKAYFDGWGSRCYMFLSELGKTGTDMLRFGSKNTVLEHMDIDLNVLKTMNGEYIFSGYQIQNASDMGLEFKARFDSEWTEVKIYLYKII